MTGAASDEDAPDHETGKSRPDQPTSGEHTGGGPEPTPGTSPGRGGDMLSSEGRRAKERSIDIVFQYQLFNAWRIHGERSPDRLKRKSS